MRCQRRLGHPVASAARVIYCDTCEDQKLARDFSPEMQSRWACLDVEEEVHCKQCMGTEAKLGAPILDLSTKYTCLGKGCSREDGNKACPRSHFVEAESVAAEAAGESVACARCQVFGDKSSQNDDTCAGCKKLT